MSTRGNFGYKKEDGSVEAMFCAHDAYPKGGLGENLLRFCPTIDDLIVLFNEVREWEKSDSRKYYEWRGLHIGDPREFGNKSMMISDGGMFNEYSYIFQNRKWYVSPNGKKPQLFLLYDFLKGKKQSENIIINEQIQSPLMREGLMGAIDASPLTRKILSESGHLKKPHLKRKEADFTRKEYLPKDDEERIDPYDSQIELDDDEMDIEDGADEPTRLVPEIEIDDECVEILTLLHSLSKNTDDERLMDAIERVEKIRELAHEIITTD